MEIEFIDKNDQNFTLKYYFDKSDIKITKNGHDNLKAYIAIYQTNELIKEVVVLISCSLLQGQWKDQVNLDSAVQELSLLEIQTQINKEGLNSLKNEYPINEFKYNLDKKSYNDFLKQRKEELEESCRKIIGFKR